MRALWPCLLLLLCCQDPTEEAPDGGPPQDKPRTYATACRPEGSPAEPPKLALTRYFSKTQIDFPIGLIPVPGERRVFLLSQVGYILSADAATPDAEAQPFLDISDRIVTGGETGLLSMALDPGFATNGWFYLNYTAMEAGELRTFVSRFRVASPPLGGVAPGSEQVLLRITQPFENHNGGQLAFGPDGFLYIGMGDGGAVGDPLDSGQRMETLHGKLLRIDVSAGDAGYRVPADNPFASGQPRANGTAGEIHCKTQMGAPGPCGEIWALGFRNLWRFSFDPVGGALWGGDVGQTDWEEINLIERGKNYGWRCLEGTHVYNDWMCEDKVKDRLKFYADPVHEYPHADGRRSVTGGFVYRGGALPALSGMYLFADYMDGQLWGLQPAPDKEPGEPSSYLRTTLLTEVGNISSFGVDAQGEIYVMRHLSGAIERLVAADPNDPGKTGWPPRLSETGCFADLRARRLVPGALPYQVRAPLWADGADKERALVLPAGTTLGYRERGPFALPPGAVLLKTFALGQRPLETRLLRWDGAGVRGATYRWNDEGTDAVLLSARSTEPLGQGQDWFYPGRGDCLLCHTKAAGHVLGQNAAQLAAMDLAGLAAAGYLTGVPPDPPPGLPAPDDKSAPVAARARAYLQGNCAHCHQPGGAAHTTLDLRAETPLGQTKVCDVAPQHGDLGVAGARVLLPGQPERSTLLLRMKSTDGKLRMPPLGTLRVDPDGVALVSAWIAALSGCQ